MLVCIGLCSTAVSIETDGDLEGLRRVGRVVALTLAETRRAVEPGARTAELGGYMADAAVTVVVPPRSPLAERLVETAETALSGHGIGRTIHEPPNVLNYREPRNRGRLTPGLVITIEPIISAQGEALRQDADGWTVRPRDGSLTAHAEHTVVVTRRGSPLVLTSAS
jgi:methionyl aminopeptidase